MIETFVEGLDCIDQYATPEEFSQLNAIEEGNQFALVRVQVLSKTTYRMVQGKLFPISIAFPVGFNEEQE